MVSKLVVLGGLAIIFAILTVGFVLAVNRSSPSLTVHQVKTVQSGRMALLTFEITNHTAKSYMSYPLSIEVLSGSKWANCCAFDTNGPRNILGPHSYISSTITVTNLPRTSPLRLKMLAHREMEGLEKLRMKFFAPLLPFPFVSSGPWFHLQPSQIVSDEFVDSQSK